MASNAKLRNLNSLSTDYFKSILKSEVEATNALSNLIEDINKDKDATLSCLVSNSEIHSILLQLFRFLHSTVPIIVGNTAFIIGTLVESDETRSKIISIMDSDADNKETSLDFLVSLLNSQDAETVMNVAGTLGTLVEKPDGLNFVISHRKCFQDLLVKINHLLMSDYLWTSSNAALILARLSIDETGNLLITSSPLLNNILVSLVNCLTFDEAGRGMNAAFALGRIFDNEKTIEKFYSVISKSKFVENLVNIVDSNDLAFMKNSCFCLSSVMSCNLGYELVVSNHSFGRLILLLEKMLLLNDDEAVWFCVLTLKAISCKVKGCKLLKKNENIMNNINRCLYSPILSADVKRECKEIIEFLSPLKKPPIPYVTVISPREIQVSWFNQISKNVFDMKHSLYCKHENDDILAYRGERCEVKVNNVEPNTKYAFYLTISNEIETSESSDYCFVTTDEDYPSEPLNLTAMVITATQVKIGWDTPEYPNGIIRHYDIHLNKGNIEQTTDRVSIISGLQPEMKYSITVFAVNSCGKGCAAEIDITTRNSGVHAPSKPSVTVLGRSEMHLTWFPPDSPMGKIFHYDVKLNRKKTIYSGTNTYFRVIALKPDTEYSFSIVAVTNMGKFQSPVCTKKTLKDEYHSPQRGPLYSVPQKLDMGDIIPNTKSRSLSLATDRKSSYTGLGSLFKKDIVRRSSEFRPQKVSSVRLPGLPTLASTRNSSHSSSTEFPTISPGTMNMILPLKFSDFKFPLPLRHPNDSLSNSTNISMSFRNSAHIPLQSQSK